MTVIFVSMHEVRLFFMSFEAFLGETARRTTHSKSHQIWWCVLSFSPRPPSEVMAPKSMKEARKYCSRRIREWQLSSQGQWTGLVIICVRKPQYEYVLNGSDAINSKTSPNLTTKFQSLMTSLFVLQHLSWEIYLAMKRCAAFHETMIDVDSFSPNSRYKLRIW